METTEQKQFGIYPGVLKDPEYPKTCTEQELYFLINSLGAFIWRMNHDMADGRIEQNLDLTEFQYSIEYSVYQLTRFGVEIAEVKEGEHVIRNQSYMDWFKWWNEYFQYTLTKEEYEKYEQLSRAGEDISSYRPEGNWKKEVESVPVDSEVKAE